MEKLLTTREVAEAIGASESSLRRWTNSGAIRTSRTVGGHRRIPLSEAIRFIRETHATVVRPQVLGLPALGLPDLNSRAGAEDLSAEERLFQALVDSDAARARGQVLALYLGGMSLAAIFDGPLASAMHRVGELWAHDARGVFLEHRATDLCVQAVSQLRDLVPPAEENAPHAVGGAPTGDPYLLPSMMAAAVLGEAGWRTTNLGPQTPLDVLAAAAEEQKARIVWLSVSTTGDAKVLQPGVAELGERIRAWDATLLVGGRHARDLLPTGMPNVRVLESMADLAAFAATPRTGTQGGGDPVGG